MVGEQMKVKSLDLTGKNTVFQSNTQVKSMQAMLCGLRTKYTQKKNSQQTVAKISDLQEVAAVS